MVAVLLALVGCDTQRWLQPDGDASHSRSNPGARTVTVDNVGSLVEAWRVAGPNVRFAVGDAVYGVSATSLYSIHPRTGAVTWTRTPSAPITGGPFIDGPDNIRISYGEATGLGFEVTYDRFGNSDAGLAIPILGGLAARRDGRSVRIRATERLDTWSWIHVSGTPLAGRIGSMFEPRATIGPDLVYVLDALTPSETDVVAYDPSKPCPDDFCPAVWRRPLYTHYREDLTLSPDGSTLYLPNEKEHAGVYAIDAHTGETKWTTDRILTRGVATSGNTVYAAGQTPGGTESPAALHAIDAGDGTDRWTGELTDPVGGLGVVATGATVVYAGFGSTIAAFPLNGCGAPTCSALWTADAGAPISSIALAQGHVYVQTTAGITAYGLPS